MKRAGVRVRVRLRVRGEARMGRGRVGGLFLFEVTEMFWTWRYGSCSLASNLKENTKIKKATEPYTFKRM